MALTILHLTDLHAGPSALKDEDLKQKVPGVGRPTLLDRLSTYLEQLQVPPDYVAITGDLTNKGDRKGLEQVKSWLTAKIEAKILPPANRILITPGNHDVTWGIEEGPKWHAKRYHDIWEYLVKRIHMLTWRIAIHSWTLKNRRSTPPLM